MAEQMKFSGIDWIGDIPASWKCSKVKFCFSLVNGSTPESSDYDCWDGDIKWITPADMSDTGTISHGERFITKYGYNSCGTTMLPVGSIVISSRAPIGKINITTTELCTNQGCKSLIRTGDNRYFYYLLLAGQHELSLLGRGTTFLELSTYDLNGLGLVTPAEDEQQAIADFLDKECAQIDSIATDLEKQIALLQQYKKSLITETVTRGLDTSVPMKDSGIEWTSKIPCHWEIKRFKYLCEYITDGSHFSPETTDEGYPYITAADVKGVGLDYDAAKKISQQDFISLQKAGCRPRKGDVLLVKDGATTGRIGMVTSEKPCVVLSSVAILRAPDNMDARYLRYLMESDFIQAQIQASMAGSAMPRTVLSKIINYWGIACPKEEQKEICDFLDKKCGYIETIIETKQVQQSTIKQHKKSLIYEYVTGKKRVKEVQ